MENLRRKLREVELLEPPGYDHGNLYAQILSGKIPSYAVFETDAALCMLYEWPEAPFHCLLLPKAASRGVDDLSEAAAAGTFRLLPRLVAAVLRASGAGGVQVTTSSSAGQGGGAFGGAFGGVVARGGPGGVPRRFVPHTAVHVVPCFEGDAEGLARAHGGLPELLQAMTAPAATKATSSEGDSDCDTDTSTGGDEGGDVRADEDGGGEGGGGATPSSTTVPSPPGSSFEAGRRLTPAEAEYTLMRLQRELRF